MRLLGYYIWCACVLVKRLRRPRSNMNTYCIKNSIWLQLNSVICISRLLLCYITQGGECSILCNASLQETAELAENVLLYVTSSKIADVFRRYNPGRFSPMWWIHVWKALFAIETEVVPRLSLLIGQGIICVRAINADLFLSCSIRLLEVGVALKGSPLRLRTGKSRNSQSTSDFRTR